MSGISTSSSFSFSLGPMKYLQLIKHRVLVLGKTHCSISPYIEGLSPETSPIIVPMPLSRAVVRRRPELLYDPRPSIKTILPLNMLLGSLLNLCFVVSAECDTSVSLFEKYGVSQSKSHRLYTCLLY